MIAVIDNEIGIGSFGRMVGPSIGQDRNYATMVSQRRMHQYPNFSDDIFIELLAFVSILTPNSWTR
jgi:hypothetical protein